MPRLRPSRGRRCRGGAVHPAAAAAGRPQADADEDRDLLYIVHNQHLTVREWTNSVQLSDPEAKVIGEVDLSQIRKGREDDPPIVAGDVIYVKKRFF